MRLHSFRYENAVSVIAKTDFQVEVLCSGNVLFMKMAFWSESPKYTWSMNPSMLCELQLHGFIVISIFFVQGQCLLLANVWALVKEEEEKKMYLEV